VRVSLTGAVSSQRVTEEREAWLSMVGNYASSVWVEARLTVRLQVEQVRKQAQMIRRFNVELPSLNGQKVR